MLTYTRYAVFHFKKVQKQLAASSAEKNGGQDDAMQLLVSDQALQDARRYDKSATQAQLEFWDCLIQVCLFSKPFQKCSPKMFVFL
jgi:hypothetical protein